MKNIKLAPSVMPAIVIKETKAVLAAICSADNDIKMADAVRRAKLLQKRLEAFGGVVNMDFGRIDERKTKKQAVLEYLQAGNELMQIDAFSLFGTTRLGAIIHKLRKAGHPIKSEPVMTSSSCYPSKYFMEVKTYKDE